MNKKFILFSAILALPVFGMAQTTHSMTIVLDTKKFANINCSLNAPCDGVTPSPLTDVYMHSGVCWQDPSNPSSATAAELFCIQQITNLNSQVWQSVVGNWGSSPQADGVGQMVSMGNGVFQRSFIVEQYYSNSDVSTDTDPVSNVTSQPMPAGEVAYTMGLVFRDPTGTISGRDSLCGDIFIWKLNSTPEVIQGSTISTWPNGPISFQYNISGVNEPELWYENRVWPNPAVDHVNIQFFIRKNQDRFKMQIMDMTGRVVRNIHEGYLPAGNQNVYWDGKNDSGEDVPAGIYHFSMQSGNNLVSDKIVLTR